MAQLKSAVVNTAADEVNDDAGRARVIVDHILKRHRTEQLVGEADAVKRRVAQLGQQHRALGQGVAHPSLEQGDRSSTPA